MLVWCSDPLNHVLISVGFVIIGRKVWRTSVTVIPKLIAEFWCALETALHFPSWKLHVGLSLSLSLVNLLHMETNSSRKTSVTLSEEIEWMDFSLIKSMIRSGWRYHLYSTFCKKVEEPANMMFSQPMVFGAITKCLRRYYSNYFLDSHNYCHWPVSAREQIHATREATNPVILSHW